MSDDNKNKSFWTGLTTGTIISILTAIVTIWVQHSMTLKEKNVQLYLDEKKDFVAACDDYLKQYRQWHELMNYAIYADTISELSEFNSSRSAAKAYIQWKKDIDFAYGKIFMLSDNEFGAKTLEVSTVLHASLSDLLENRHNQNDKIETLKEVDNYFIENWLTKAQEEIFRFNTGKRMQKTLKEYISELKDSNNKEIIKEKNDSQMYENLNKEYEYIKRQDSLSGRKTQSRMPTRQELKEFVEEGKK